jgi:SAM-dependent methyltransferase
VRDRDTKHIVSAGYDRLGKRFGEWAIGVRQAERARYTSLLLETLPAGARLLELGCGPGIPTTRALAERFDVTGVDLSAVQLGLARRNVPAATFVQADMARLSLAPATFDAVAAFYSLIHVPRHEQPGLLQEIAGWLRPGGWLVATMSAEPDRAGYEPDWLDVPMYWSGFDAETNCRLVAAAGLTLVGARRETAEEMGQPVTFLWIVAQKPDCKECR